MWDLGGNRSTAQLDKLAQNPSGGCQPLPRPLPGALHLYNPPPCQRCVPQMPAPLVCANGQPPPARLASCQPQPRCHGAAEVIKSCRFLGRAEVALADTLSMLSGVPAGTPLWLPLMRRDAGDAVRCAPGSVCLLTHQFAPVLVNSSPSPHASRPTQPPHPRRPCPPCRSGPLQLRFVWEVTARSLLTIKMHALERVLAQRREILAALQPVPPGVVRGWAPPESGAAQAEAAERTARGGVMGAGVNLFGVDNELGMSGGWLERWQCLGRWLVGLSVLEFIGAG